MPLNWPTLKLPAFIVTLFAVAGIGLTVVITDENGDDRPDRIVIELRGQDDQPAGVPAGPETLELGERGLDVLEDAEANEVGDHDGEVNERPPGVPAEDLLAAVRQQEAYALTDNLPVLTPLAAPSQRGCSTKLVGNYSSRNGVRPRLFVLHYTVSPNRLGRSDVDGITAYFNGAGSQASSHYVIDNEGHCNYIVRETSKAWTQGVFNPVAIAVEVINTGQERTYAGTAGMDKLSVVLADASRRWDIPLQRGAVNGNCTVARPGVIDHNALTCNDHTDIAPYNEAIAQVIAKAKAIRSAASSPLTKPERTLARRACREPDNRRLERRVRARMRVLTGRARRAGSWRKHRRGVRRRELARHLSGKAC